MKENPFLIHGYKGPEYFCDRQEETANIIDAFKNGCNITLISPRRYGKTGLIHNVFHRLKELDKVWRLYATATRRQTTDPCSILQREISI